MLILIHLDHVEPPSGTVALPRDPERLSDNGYVMEFTGWLALLPLGLSGLGVGIRRRGRVDDARATVPPIVCGAE